MANDLNRSVLSNPMVLWADLGLRALDMSLSLSHSICNGVDRLSRAAASDQAVMKSTTWHSTVSGSSALTATAEDTTVVPTSERPGFDLMTQGWLQWMSTLGTVVSLGADRGLRQPATRRHLAPDDVPRNPLAIAAGPPATYAQSGSSLRNPIRPRHQQDAEFALEHAVASAAPKSAPAARLRSPVRKQARSR